MEPVCLAWLLVTFAVSFLGLWLVFLPNAMPQVLAETLIYGKVGDSLKRVSFVKWIQVPKQWFTHFYIFAVIQNVIATILICALYVGHIPIPRAVTYLLDILAPTRTATIGVTSTVLAMLLVLFQTSRRTYECLFISVYSPATMNVLHYMLGFCFYFGVTATLLNEAPGFQSANISDNATMSFEAVSWYHILGVALFFYGSYHHYQAHAIFAALRKDKKGKVVSTKHFIPTGGLFNYISCPHYFAEIVIYFGLAVVLELQHTTWWLVIAWTFSSQVLTAVLTHQWYLETYKDYPKNRKAVIPFLL